jgi:hypothetical protein
MTKPGFGRPRTKFEIAARLGAPIYIEFTPIYYVIQNRCALSGNPSEKKHTCKAEDAGLSGILILSIQYDSDKNLKGARAIVSVCLNLLAVCRKLLAVCLKLVCVELYIEVIINIIKL